MVDRAAKDQTGVFSAVARDTSLSDKVAADITKAILDGVLKPGEPLMAERELATQFGVSRTVIREAVRSLVPSGLVEARSGRGLQVAEVSPDALNRSMDVFLRRSRDIDYPRVYEVRSALEVDMAGFAAERATAEDIRELRSLTRQLGSTRRDDVMQAAELDVAFHEAVAKATQNELFTTLLVAIGPVMIDVRLRAFARPETLEEATSAHKQILEQIAAGAPDGARDAMRDHLQQGAELWLGGDIPGPISRG